MVVGEPPRAQSEGVVRLLGAVAPGALPSGSPRFEEGVDAVASLESPAEVPRQIGPQRHGREAVAASGVDGEEQRLAL